MFVIILNYSPLFAAPKSAVNKDTSATVQEHQALAQMAAESTIAVGNRKLNTEERRKKMMKTLIEPGYFSRVPRWTDACDIESKLNHAIITIKASDHRALKTRAQPTSNIEEYPHLHSGGRQKRSVKGSSSKGAFVHQVERGSILFKSPSDYHYGVKKTSFANRHKASIRYFYSAPITDGSSKLAAIAASSNHHSNSEPAKIGLIAKEAKSDELVEPEAILAERARQARFLAKIANSSQKEELQRIKNQIFANDIRLSWHINNAVGSIDSIRKLLVTLNQKIQGDQEKASLSSEDQRDLKEAVDRHLQWLPRLGNVLRKNEERNYESADLIFNLSRYFQIFSALLEQMNYDQNFADRKTNSQYFRFEQRMNGFLCNIETLGKLFKSLREDRVRFIELMRASNLTGGSEEQIFRFADLSQLESMEARLRYKQDVIEGPRLDNEQLIVTERVDRMARANSSEQLDVSLEKIDRDKIFVSRDVIPIDLRILDSQFEKNHRDLALFKAMNEYLDYSKTALHNIHNSEYETARATWSS